MSACAAHVDRLMGAISVETGAEILRGPDGIYLFGSDRDEGLVMSVGPGGDEAVILMQAVLGDLPAGKEAGMLRGLLQANAALDAMGWPVFALNGATGTVLCTKSLRRQDDSGVERDPAWMLAAMTVFLNAAARARALLEDGAVRLPADPGAEPGDGGNGDEILIRL